MIISCSRPLTVLGVVEGPCQRFAGGVVATTHSTLVVSGLGVEDVVAARLLRRHKTLPDYYSLIGSRLLSPKMTFDWYLLTLSSLSFVRLSEVKGRI